MDKKDNSQWISLGQQAEQLIQQGEIELAKELLKQTIEMEPNRPCPYYLLASITYDDYDPKIISSMGNPAILHQKPPRYPGLIY